MKVEFNSRVVFEVPFGTISEAGIALIMHHISTTKFDDEWKSLNPNFDKGFVPPLPEEWDYRMVAEHGGYRGRFSKRVSQYYHKVHGLTCPASFLSELGNIAGAHSGTATTFEFEFRTKIDWNAGAFGDRGSCYWGGNSGARQMVEENGYAVCFFFEGRGYGRAWIAPIDDELIVVFNGYGYQTVAIARVLARYFGVTYKRVGLTNAASVSGVLYINNGGYALGSEDRLRDLTHVSLNWEEAYTMVCYACESPIHEGDSYTGADDEDYCESCYYDRFSSCDTCGDVFFTDDLNLVDDEYACDYCIDRHYVRCDVCESLTHKRNTVEKGSKTVCHDCQ